MYKGRLVGKLAETASGKVAFQYDEQWLADGFSLSPFSLPLRSDVFVPSNYNYDGLFGVFADSLPDSWGRLLLDRFLKSKGISPDIVTIVDRLSIVGRSGMGALEYIPENPLKVTLSERSVDELAAGCEQIFSSSDAADVDQLFLRGGSSGGARPKAYVNADGKEWIVKFPYRKDPYSSGTMEYEYSVCARDCGIDMPETRLFPSDRCDGYFGVIRFDRPKRHMISAAALLEVDFERSSSDYNDLMKLTRIITSDNKHDVDNMYRRMCFNVFAVNQDDHLKNFSYLYDDKSDIWRLSPAYDLTHIVTGYGEHTTTVNGRGKDICIEDLVQVGKAAGMNFANCRQIAEDIQEKTKVLKYRYCM